MLVGSGYPAPRGALTLVVNRLTGSLRLQRARTSGFLAVQLPEDGFRLESFRGYWMASAAPKRSPASAVSGSSGLSWVNSWLPAPESPPADPYSTLTAPASTMAPTSSEETPTAGSAKPSLSKSARTAGGSH